MDENENRDVEVRSCKENCSPWKFNSIILRFSLSSNIFKSQWSNTGGRHILGPPSCAQRVARSEFMPSGESAFVSHTFGPDYSPKADAALVFNACSRCVPQIWQIRIVDTLAVGGHELWSGLCSSRQNTSQANIYWRRHRDISVPFLAMPAALTFVYSCSIVFRKYCVNSLWFVCKTCTAPAAQQS